MNTFARLALMLCLLLRVLLLPAAPVARADGDPEVAARLAGRPWAQQHAELRSSTPLLIAPSSDSFSAALDLPPSVPVTVSREGDPASAGTFANFGVIRPSGGASFVVLSSGIAGTTAPEIGADFGPEGEEGDVATIRFDMTLPSDVRWISFDYNFLSAEFPEFVGSRFNDTFRALLVDKFGVREVARGSVNSSSFKPASATIAGGSGFDIYSGGRPDAGLTGLVTVSAEVRDPATSLVVTVFDTGDGIYDSAVIVDNLSFAAIEAVDPVPALVSSSGAVVSDPQQLSTLGTPVRAVSADGVTQVLLRTRVGGPGEVRLCLDGATAPRDGGLRLVGSIGRNACVNAPVVETSQGYIAFALYVAPEDFNRGGDERLAERPVAFKAEQIVGGTQTARLTLQLVRPPVVLIHGLWSEADTWTFALVNDARFRVSRVDYRPTNAAWFATNRQVLFFNSVGIREVLQRDRNNRIATTQVDVAGHSMGGLLSRIYSQDANYRNRNNYFEGSINRLVTLNTPHTGSPFANFLVSTRGVPLLGWGIAKVLGPERRVDLGAVDDLAQGSPALAAIGYTNVPAHAMVGVGGSDLVGGTVDALRFVPGYIGAVFRVASFFKNSTTLFDNMQHDTVVGRQSQEGGMPGAATTVLGGLESIHTPFVTQSASYSNRLVQLLNTSVSDSAFARFPAVATIMSAPADGLAAALVAPAAVFSDTLRISSPPVGSVVRPGQSVRVTVVPPTGVTLTRVLFTGFGDAVVDESAPFEADLPVPATAIGPFAIGAVGADAADNYYTAPDVPVTAEPVATLTGVSIEPDEVFLFAPGEQRALTVLGSYSDGITRTLLPGPGLGALISSNPELVSVSADGLLTAVNPGTATILALGPDFSTQDSITVQFAPENITPVANAGQNFTALVNTTVALDGRGSVDPDGSPGAVLSYDWQQIDGRPVALSGRTTVSPSFTPTETGLYTFSLIVRDAQSESTPATVRVRVVERNLAPVASAGPDQTAEAGDLVTLDGRSSSDPDGALGDVLGFQWQQSGGPAVQLSNPAAPQPSFTPAATGLYTFTLTVSDTLSLSPPDSVVVTVVPRNIAPQADAGADQTVELGDQVTLDGSASADLDGSPGEVLTYSWQQTGGPAVTLSDPRAVRPTFTPSGTGAYSFTLQVRDRSRTSAPDVVTVTVVERNLAPLADVGPDQQVAVGAVVTLDGSRSRDPDMKPGEVLTYSWQQTGGPPVALSDAGSARPTFVPRAAGVYTFSLTVRDQRSASSPATVTVRATWRVHLPLARR
jgi:pimeloyl-ACP methyl ester carboxylesterase